jgi:hypothetical protein
VATTERIYKAYAEKLQHNYKWALENPKQFADALNSEYKKLRNSKIKKLERLNKLPVRIYGSGDYIPGHLKFISELNFKSYLISKSLTMKTMVPQIDELLKVTNLVNIVLSFDKSNIKNYENVKHLLNTDRFTFSFTGLPTEFDEIKRKGYTFNIFFNISDKKSERLLAQQFKEQCPCDSGVLEHNLSCSVCNKCWRSSLTKGPIWNSI